VEGQGPVDDVLVPAKGAGSIFRGTVQLLLEEGEEEGILFFAFLQRFQRF